MSNMLKNLKNYVEIEFLKSLSYKEINSMFNEFNDKYTKLEAKVESVLKLIDSYPENLDGEEGRKLRDEIREELTQKKGSDD